MKNPVSERAKQFRKARINRFNEIAEDYTELIAKLLDEQGQARVCEIAKEMGISHVSVLRTLKRLIRDGYMSKDVNGIISLTAKGEEMAIFSKRKHLVLTDFLLKLGVPKKIAETDVEGIEHYISPTTLKAIEAYLSRP